MKSSQTPVNLGWAIRSASLVIVLLVSGVASAQWETVWELGAPGRGWPQDQGGVIFVQEANVNPPPGDPNSPPVNQQADDDYYVAGTYPDPIGTVDDELVSERAFAGLDVDLRIHFNLDTLTQPLHPDDKFRFSFEANNLDERAENPNPRHGVEIWANIKDDLTPDVRVMDEIVISPAELNTVFTTPEFTAAQAGFGGDPGVDNVIWVRGINKNADGGGNWMGLDYHHLEILQVPEPGSFSMMLSGLIWFLPFVCYERRGKKKRT
jgi:hypothetical protein